MALMSVSSIAPFTQIVQKTISAQVFQSMIAQSVSATVSSLMLPLIIMCAILTSLSFARDYEQGMMQSTLSLPVSRKLYFITKFAAVILPLTLLAWFFTTFFVIITFYSNALLALQLSFFALPVSFLFLMFCGSLGVLIALTIKRTIPTVLATMLTNFFLWFTASVNTSYALSVGGDFANYLALNPYKTSLIFLNKLLNFKEMTASQTGTFESTLPVEFYGILAIVYAFILTIPIFIYFYRRFEICE